MTSQIYVYDETLQGYRKITYKEVKEALLSDISHQGENYYYTGSPGVYENLPNGIVEPNPTDETQVTFSTDIHNFIAAGLSQRHISYQILEELV